MYEILKSIGRKKFFHILIIVQFALSLVYFFVCVALIQKVFYANISALKELDIGAKNIIHLEIQTGDVSYESFNKFIDELKIDKLKCIGAYHNQDMYVDAKNDYIAALSVVGEIDGVKEMSLKEGRKFEKDDYLWTEAMGTESCPIPAVVGSRLASDCDLAIDSIIYDSEVDEYYKVIGILQSDSKWFYQYISDGYIISLDEQIIIPEQDETSVYMNYYGVINEGQGKDNIIRDINVMAKKNNVTMKATLISQELEDKFEESLSENKQWLFFSIAILIMVSIGTASLVTAHLYSRKREVGIRMAMGYSNKKITSLFVGEIAVIGIISGLIAFAISKGLIGDGNADIMETAYSSGMYISTEMVVIGILILILMCVPSIILLKAKIAKMNPKELIGGKE